MSLVGVSLSNSEKTYIYIELPATYNELIQKLNSKIKLITDLEFKNKSITFIYKKRLVSIIDDETYKNFLNLKIDELDCILY